MSDILLNFSEINALHQAGELEKARLAYLQFLQLHPQDDGAWDALGILYHQLENAEEAKKCLEQAVLLSPTTPLYKLHLANVLKSQQAYTEAEKILQDLLTDFPHSAAGFNNIGTVYFSQNKLAEAIKAYQTAINLQADYIDAYYNLGLALHKKGQIEESKNVYEALLQLAPKHAPAQFQLASIEMQQQKFEKAILHFKHIAELHPHHFETQTNLASCYLRLGNLQDAKYHYLKALEIYPQDTQILFNLGVIEMQASHIQEAIRYYMQAIKIDNNLFDVHNNLGFLYLTLQNSPQALLHFREALRLDPNNKALQHTIHILTQEKNISGSPNEYIKSLFDSYADHFEPHLLKHLHYQVPTLFLELLKNNMPFMQRHWHILDLGCGTGLCGELFKPYALTLTGVDLSKKMLEIAKQKNSYDELIAEDILTFLNTTQKTFDLIIGGDVLVYFGDLESLFASIYKVLSTGGYFIYNAEINSQTDAYHLSPSGRFVHQRTYLDELAKRYHFKIMNYQTLPLRTQNDRPVFGHVYVLQKD